ncbi:MAG: aldehyde dehydrogenase [Rhizobiales bacterium 62-47]|nr:aldehyde dehydrogenase [Hyphomicrobiales bacterium]OJY08501.1 MAG: aldehyde dehydrogenase [Rhizobiales bacterium 62-47]
MIRNDRLDRREVVRHLLKGRKNEVVVSGLGASTYDVAAAGDHARNFYLWGAMGGAVMIGLGLALAQPAVPVVVITGDGETLMGMGSLATVGLQRPANLSIVVLDNGSYGETGGQPSHTAATTDLTAVARGCGIADTCEILTLSELEAFAASLHSGTAGPRFAVVKIDGAEQERVLTHRDGHFLVARVRQALGFQPI